MPLNKQIYQLIKPLSLPCSLFYDEEVWREVTGEAVAASFSMGEANER